MARAERSSKPRAAPAPTRAERRQALQAKRSRTLLVSSIVVSAIAIAAWFPVTALLHQHEQLAAASTELAHVDQQNSSLRRQAGQLETPGAIARIAEQQYNLVAPGEQAYQVLPSTSSKGSSATGTLPSSTTGTPAAPPLGTPAKKSAAPSKAKPAPSSSFLSRVLQTLEFWR